MPAGSLSVEQLEVEIAAYCRSAEHSLGVIESYLATFAVPADEPPVVVALAGEFVTMLGHVDSFGRSACALVRSYVPVDAPGVAVPSPEPGPPVPQPTGGGSVGGSGGGRTGSPDPVEWWRYVTLYARQLGEEVTLDNPVLGVRLPQNWQDDLHPETRELFAYSLSAQSQRFLTVELDAREFQRSWQELQDKIHEFHVALAEAILSIVVLAGGILGAIAKAAELIAKIAAGIAAAGGVGGSVDAFVKLATIRAPEPPSLICSTWPRPPQ